MNKAIKLIKANRGFMTKNRLLLFMNVLKYRDVAEVYIFNENGFWKIQSEPVVGYAERITIPDYDALEKEHKGIDNVVENIYPKYMN